jgi:hypothetical protein
MSRFPNNRRSDDTGHQRKPPAVTELQLESQTTAFVWRDYFLRFIAVESKYRQRWRQTVTRPSIGTGLISPSSRKDESAPITVIALSPPMPFHLGKVKSSTSALTRSF